jgi:hypothetical protein
VIERFAVPAGEDDAFLAAWAEAGDDAVLLRALRDDAAYRYVAVEDDGERRGVWRIAWLDEAPGDPPTGRQGFLGARVYPDGPRFVEVQRWSSPLMVQRAGLTEGATLYVAYDRA